MISDLVVENSPRVMYVVHITIGYLIVRIFFLFMCSKQKYQLSVILFIIHGNNTLLTNNHSSGSPGIDS